MEEIQAQGKPEPGANGEGPAPIKTFPPER